ncbi:MAG: J domain-containing protein [Trichlorobacter sp.]|jgi:hypothetical protein
MTYADLQAALHLFSLHEGDLLTIRRIKERHRCLVKQHHPDHGAADPEMIRQINAAHRLLMEYLQTYRFSFTEDEFYRQNPEEHLRRQFSWDPVWSGRLEEK